MREAAARLDVAAHNVASASTPGLHPARVVSQEAPAGGVQFAVTLGVLEGVDVGAELVASMVAQAALAASARVLQQSLRTERAALALLA